MSSSQLEESFERITNAEAKLLDLRKQLAEELKNLSSAFFAGMSESGSGEEYRGIEASVIYDNLREQNYQPDSREFYSDMFKPEGSGRHGKTYENLLQSLRYLSYKYQDSFGNLIVDLNSKVNGESANIFYFMREPLRDHIKELLGQQKQLARQSTVSSDLAVDYYSKIRSATDGILKFLAFDSPGGERDFSQDFKERYSELFRLLSVDLPKEAGWNEQDRAAANLLRNSLLQVCESSGLTDYFGLATEKPKQEMPPEVVQPPTAKLPEGNAISVQNSNKDNFIKLLPIIDEMTDELALLMQYRKHLYKDYFKINLDQGNEGRSPEQDKLINANSAKLDPERQAKFEATEMLFLNLQQIIQDKEIRSKNPEQLREEIAAAHLASRNILGLNKGLDMHDSQAQVGATKRSTWGQFKKNLGQKIGILDAGSGTSIKQILDNFFSKQNQADKPLTQGVSSMFAAKDRAHQEVQRTEFKEFKPADPKQTDSKKHNLT